MKRRILSAIFLPVLMLAAAGCGPDYQAKIESDTSWTARFDQVEVDGSGNKTIDLPDDHDVCIVVTKLSETGFVKVTLVDFSTDFFSSDVEIASSQTEQKGGAATVCTSTGN